MKHLSGLDAAFLHIESPEMPMHIGSLNVLRLPEGYQGDFYEDVKAHMASRIHLAELFTRKLVLMPRETPLHVGHCRLLLQAAEMGAVIAPPMPAFYNDPQTLDDIVNHSVGRVLDLFGIESGLVKRWQGARAARQNAAKK